MDGKAELIQALGGEKEVARLSRLESSEIRKELDTLLDLNIKTIARVAFLLNILDERGEPPTAMTSQDLGLYRKIAAGGVAMGLVGRYWGTSILRKLARYPFGQQKKLEKEHRVELLIAGQDSPLMADPLDMRPSQIKQVFGDEGIRSLAQQRLWLEDRSLRAKKDDSEFNDAETKLEILMSVRERKRLNRVAKYQGTSESDIIRNLLKANGLI